ncbi:MAG: inositol monophosphatase [Minisyncoccia bacterium]
MESENIMIDITSTVLPIIRATRELLLPKYGCVEELTRKGAYPASAVTELDLAVEAFLAAELKKSHPSIGFVGEESGGDRSAERFWLCDPIDGTGYYIRGVPFCTVMLALIEGEKVVFGAIYDFVNDVVYHAERGKGAFANERKISVSGRGIDNAYIMLESRIEKQENLALYLELHKRVCLTKTMCSGYEHVMVATGGAEARICRDPYGKDYDYAAGSLLVEEAGGIVANLGKHSYDYRNRDYIAANPVIFKALTEGSDALFPLE